MIGAGPVSPQFSLGYVCCVAIESLFHPRSVTHTKSRTTNANEWWLRRSTGEVVVLFPIVLIITSACCYRSLIFNPYRGGGPSLIWGEYQYVVYYMGSRACLHVQFEPLAVASTSDVWVMLRWQRQLRIKTRRTETRMHLHVLNYEFRKYHNQRNHTTSTDKILSDKRARKLLRRLWQTIL